jgi:hypothetical protein
MFTRGQQKWQSPFRMCKSSGSEQELPLTRVPPWVRAAYYRSVFISRSMIAFWYGRRRAAAHVSFLRGRIYEPFPVRAANQPFLRLLTCGKALELNYL